MKKIKVGKSKTSGKGAFAEEPIKKGELIMRMEGPRADMRAVARRYRRGEIRWDDPFEIGGGQYIILEKVPLSINHSCRPNAGIRSENELFALRTITKGEELSYDYSTVVGKNAPGERDWKMRCKCGSPNCRQSIGNWQTLPKSRLHFYKKLGALPRFILKQI